MKKKYQSPVINILEYYYKAIAASPSDLITGNPDEESAF